MHHRITALSMTFWTIPWSPKPWLVRIVFMLSKSNRESTDSCIKRLRLSNAAPAEHDDCL